MHYESAPSHNLLQHVRIQVFYFTDYAPLLLILEDFMPQLDAFFVSHEDLLLKCVSLCHQSEGDSSHTESDKYAEAFRDFLSTKAAAELADQPGLVREDVDEKYVEAMEMSCLVKQRLLDVCHSWNTVTQRALCDHDKYKSTC